MRWQFPAAAALALALAGCSNEPYKVAQVSGRITVDGKPVEQAAIMFQPVATDGNINPGPGSYGITDADGRYSLKLIGVEKPGAVVGRHLVRVENYTPPGDPHDDRPRKPVKPAIPIPGRYSRIKAMLEYTVKAGGATDADFPLTTQEKPETPAVK